jgi:hypothetical protein
MPFDYATDRPRAEAILRRLCVGAQVDGIRFGPIPQLLITDHASDKPPVSGQAYLNLASTWHVYPYRPDTLPRGEDALEMLEEAEEVRRLCELRGALITEVELGADAPDLLLTFADGRVFFLNGHHDQYEMWQFGVAFAPGLGTLVVACPGNEVAVWDLPEPADAAPAV